MLHLKQAPWAAEGVGGARLGAAASIPGAQQSEHPWGARTSTESDLKMGHEAFFLHRLL